MLTWWPALCLFVFVTHMPFFVWRWRQTGELRFAATSVTFALLSATYALRVFAPDSALWGSPLWQWVRVPAWAAAAVSLGLLGRHHLVGLRRARTAGPCGGESSEEDSGDGAPNAGW